MSKKKLAVCIDLDDCIFSFLGPFLDSYNKRCNNYISLSDLVDYEFDREKSSLLHKMEEEGFYSNLPLEFGAVTFIDKLQTNGISIIFITARPEEFKRDTIIALNNNKVIYEDIIFSKNKPEVLHKLSKKYNILCFIDDRAKTVINVSKNCKLPFIFMINKPHNRRIQIFEQNIFKIDYIMDVWGFIKPLIRRSKNGRI